MWLRMIVGWRGREGGRGAGVAIKENEMSFCRFFGTESKVEGVDGSFLNRLSYDIDALGFNFTRTRQVGRVAEV